MKSAVLNNAVINYKGKFEMTQEKGKEQISVNFINS